MVSDLDIGKAGEHLVCCDLLLRGCGAMLSGQGMPFDVLAHVGNRLIKIQVKTTRETRPTPQRREQVGSYLFHVRRCGKGGRQSYDESDADMFALVALDNMQIGYVAAVDARQTMMLRSESNRGMYYDEVMQARYSLIHSLKASGKSNSDIAKKMGLDKSYIGRVLKRGGECNIPAGQYLSELTFDIACKRIEDAQRQEVLF